MRALRSEGWGRSYFGYRQPTPRGARPVVPQDSLERALLDGLPAAEGLRQVIHTPVHLAGLG